MPRLQAILMYTAREQPISGGVGIVRANGKDACAIDILTWTSLIV